MTAFILYQKKYNLSIVFKKIFQKIFFEIYQKDLTKSKKYGIILCVRKNVIYALVAQLDRVTGYEPVGQGFESLRARKLRIRKYAKLLFLSEFCL